MTFQSFFRALLRAVFVVAVFLFYLVFLPFLLSSGTDVGVIAGLVIMAATILLVARWGWAKVEKWIEFSKE